ncbi:peptidase S8/S53 domain-containing protein [Cladochytrium replicatum]|nr:peptidase S8/S53 domain-containing protein [Cladochytrium replicatum]
MAPFATFGALLAIVAASSLPAFAQPDIAPHHYRNNPHLRNPYAYPDHSFHDNEQDWRPEHEEYRPIGPQVNPPPNFRHNGARHGRWRARPPYAHPAYRHARPEYYRDHAVRPEEDARIPTHAKPNNHATGRPAGQPFRPFQQHNNQHSASAPAVSAAAAGSTNTSSILDQIGNAIDSVVNGGVTYERYIILLNENITDAQLTEHLSAVQSILDKLDIDVNATSVFRGIAGKFNKAVLNFNGYYGAFPTVVIDYLKKSPLVSVIEKDAVVSTGGIRPSASILAGTNYNGTEGFNQNAVLVQRTGVSWNLDRVSRRQGPAVVASQRRFVYPTSAGKGVDIYILDTGVLTSHEEFEGRATWGAYFTEAGQQSTKPANEDADGHGTNVASIAAGKTYGVAKDANIIAVKVLDDKGSGLISTIVAGIQWALTQAGTSGRRSVINMSLGGENSKSSGTTSAIGRAIKAGFDAGVVFAVAAGNDGVDACNYTPSNLDYVVTVGASSNSDGRASFSNYGSCVSIYAPGTNIQGAYSGGSSFTGSRTAAVAVGNGTSQACPHVSGVMALILAESKNATPSAVYSTVMQSATFGALTGLNATDPNLLLYTGFGSVAGNTSAIDLTTDSNSGGSSSVFPSGALMGSLDFWKAVGGTFSLIVVF